MYYFFFSSRRRHTRFKCDWSSDVCSSDLSASLILYNTCSIREKAAQKVFSRLGEYRTKQAAGQIIGVLGCVAQQEGKKIFERAPWVSLVCGSASYRKLPDLLSQLVAGNQRVTGLETDTDETLQTPVTHPANL